MLGSTLKKLRQERQLTQQQIADLLKMNRVSYTQYELDKRDPDTSTLKLLADFFNVSTDYLLGRTSTVETIALHRTDDPMDDLPPEAIERIEEFKELMRLKYKKKPTSK